MDKLVESLMEELNCNTVFTIPLFGGIPVLESVVVTWIIMAIMMIGSLILVKGLKMRNIGKKQAALESGFTFLYRFFGDLLGEDGKAYIPYPINVLELFIRPLSLCMRLFGNVLGAVVVMALIKYLLPVVVPLPFSGYFDIFDGVIQAYVFVFLTSLYIKEAVE